jgi:hypothetical protein
MDLTTILMLTALLSLMVYLLFAKPRPIPPSPWYRSVGDKLWYNGESYYFTDKDGIFSVPYKTKQEAYIGMKEHE